MSDNRGYFKLWRALLDKPIWTGSTLEQKVVLISIMSLASHKHNEWDWDGSRFAVKPGQCVTSLKSIAELAGVSTQNTRTALKRFEKLEFLTNKSTNRGRLITIINWNIYQSDNAPPNKPTNKPLTSPQQALNKPLTTINNVKNVKNVKNERIDKDIYVRIITHLNTKTEKNFNPSSKKTQSLINVRFKEGFTEQDFIAVINNKHARWFTDPKMCEYLRPETLFGSKFESYLNDIPPQTTRLPEKTIRTLQNLEGWENKDEKQESV